ncbi:MAG: 30S ribosomal protein S9 [Patescibacteria group bacterium]|nr:30S ribosomal protein S9 [Patescibacteria group bacterium]
MPVKKATKKTTKTTAKSPRKTVKKHPVILKKEDVKIEKPAESKAAATKSGKYIRAIGRRKCAIAQVRLYQPGKGSITINDKPLIEYFTVASQQICVNDPLKTVGLEGSVDITAKVSGGGKHGQSEAVRLGIARSIIALNPELKSSLKKPGFLTRDSRVKERKKPGLKRARRAPQWSKR